MSDSAARIRVSLSDGSFEIEGSEEFVSKQSDVYKDLITKALQNPSTFRKANGVIDTEDQKDKDYGNVFHRDGANVKVLADLPGKSQKGKTISAALIALFAMGDNAEVAFNAVRKICEDHSCLNKGNFATYLKDEKKLLLIGGSGKSLTVRLTQPGKAAANKLVAALAAQNG